MWIGSFLAAWANACLIGCVPGWCRFLDGVASWTVVGNRVEKECVGFPAIDGPHDRPRMALSPSDATAGDACDDPLERRYPWNSRSYLAIREVKNLSRGTIQSQVRPIRSRVRMIRSRTLTLNPPGACSSRISRTVKRYGPGVASFADGKRTRECREHVAYVSPYLRRYRRTPPGRMPEASRSSRCRCWLA